MSEEKTSNDPLRYEEMLHGAGWTVFCKEQCNYFAVHHLTGQIVEVFTDYQDLESRTEEENYVWDRSWACYMLFEVIGKSFTERQIKKKQRQQEEDEYLS